MPTTGGDYEKVKVQADKASALSKESGQYSAAATGLSGTVMAAVRADRANRGVSKLAEGVGATMGQIPVASAEIRQRAGDLVNPLEVDVLTARQRGQQLETLGTLARQQEYESGTLTDILGEQANQLLAIAKNKKAEADAAASEAANLFQELEWNRQQQMDAWSQYVDQEKLDQEWAKINKPSGTENKGLRGLNALLALQSLGQGEPPQMSAEAGTVVDGWEAVGQNADGTTRWVNNNAPDLATLFTDPNNIAALVTADPDNASDYFRLGEMYQEYAKQEKEAMGIQSFEDLPTSGERNEARDTADRLRSLVAIESMVSGGTKTGPISSLLNTVGKTLGAPTDLKAVNDKLTELRNKTRQSETGVHFSPTEQKEYLDRIPSGMNQEGTILDSVEQLKANEISRLRNLGFSEEFIQSLVSTTDDEFGSDWERVE